MNFSFFRITTEVPVYFSDISMNVKDGMLRSGKKVATSETVRKKFLFSYFYMKVSETHDLCVPKCIDWTLDVEGVEKILYKINITAKGTKPKKKKKIVARLN